MALLEIQNLNFKYNGSEKNTLEDISLTVEAGELILLCGASGCGKTTLLRLIKKQLRPAGELTGNILYKGVPLDSMDEKTSVSEIGYVMQDPNAQTVTDRVWRELAFGLESLGESNSIIRRRVAEVCGFFGIENWYHKKTDELSGGQKQLLALASATATDPKLLILDEPTAQLDPIAATEFISSLKKLSDELGVTVIIAEHRLEEIFPIASRVVLMDGGKIVMSEVPRSLGKKMLASPTPHRLSLGLPTAVRLFAGLNGTGECPLTVREGKKYIYENYSGEYKKLPIPEPKAEQTEALSLENVYFRYGRELPDVLKGMDLTVYKNEFLCILGANGTGKTTLLNVMSGVKKPYSGKYLINGKSIKKYSGDSLYKNNIAYLPQDPKALFVENTVYEDLLELTKPLGIPQEIRNETIESISSLLEIRHLYKMHPYDISGGEQQKVALAKLLLTDPQILLLDEPTKGLDAYSKKQLAEIIAKLKEVGKTIVAVTHDIEFAAEYSDRCAMFFDGQAISVDDRISFFASNRYYTTAAARMTRPTFENAVTVEMAIELCKLNKK